MYIAYLNIYRVYIYTYIYVYFIHIYIYIYKYHLHMYIKEIIYIYIYRSYVYISVSYMCIFICIHIPKKMVSLPTNIWKIINHDSQFRNKSGESMQVCKPKFGVYQRTRMEWPNKEENSSKSET